VAFVNSDFEGLIAAVRQRRNISQTQKWASVSLGTLLPQAVAKLPAYQNGPLIAAWMANRSCGHRPTQATKRSAEGSVPLPRDCSAAERRPYGHHIPPPHLREDWLTKICVARRRLQSPAIRTWCRSRRSSGSPRSMARASCSSPSGTVPSHRHRTHRTRTRTTAQAHAPPHTHHRARTGANVWSLMCPQAGQAA
jgi:hypothetical protein